MTKHNSIYLNSLFTKGKRVKYSRIKILEGIFYLLESGCKWKDLPKSFPPITTLKYHFYKWQKNESLELVLQTLNKEVRQNKGLSSDCNQLIIDSSSVSNSSYSDCTGYDGHKKVKGIKRFILVDELGLLYESSITSANTAEVKGAKIFCTKRFNSKYPYCNKILADKGYTSSDLQRNFAKINIGFKPMLRLNNIKNKSNHPIAVNIYSKRISIAQYLNREIRKERWKVERTFAWMTNYRRLTKNFEKTQSSAKAWLTIFGIALALKKLKQYPLT